MVEIVVEAGEHPRENCPVSFEIPGGLKEKEGNGILLNKEGGKGLPCQWETQKGKTKVTFLLNALAKGESTTLELLPDEQPDVEPLELDQAEDKIGIRVRGQDFSAYNYGGELARPFLHPILSPNGKLLVRELLENEPGAEHPHHRGIWVAHGDVNGVDNWSELEGHGCTVHREFRQQASGAVYGVISTANDWVSKERKKIMEEDRTMVFYNLPDCRMIDFSITFRATEGKVTFGDTKEGGILSLRVAISMNADKDGKLENSYGAINESEVWGKRAAWCDYSGPVEGEKWGIVVYEHPFNPLYPTYWHARGYGLMTANYFGVSHFLGERANKKGDMSVEKGSEVNFSYRVYIHRGNAQEGKVKERYHGYINPPRVEISA